MTNESFLCCPHCRRPLQLTAERWTCEAGTHSGAVHFGIPDLRVGGDPFLTRDEDLRAAEQLAARAASGFQDMLAWYYATNAKVPAAQAARFIGGVVAAGDRASASLATWGVLSGGRLGRETPALDIGAGTAPLAIAMAREGRRTFAIDAGLRWLVIAAQRCREAKVAVTLACANTEASPFAAGTFGLVAGESVIELTTDPAASLLEVHRVLAAGGWMGLTTPNRLFVGPDPHVGMLAAGYFSEARVARWAERRGMVPPRRRLFSAAQLQRAARAAGFDGVRVAVPQIAAAQRDGLGRPGRLAVDLYNVARRLPVAGAALRLAGPTLTLAGHKR